MLIKKIISKPSEALQAMVDGLLEQSERPDFEVNMKVFGAVQGGICYGCAATCAIQKIAGRNLDIDSIDSSTLRAWTLGFLRDDMLAFESAINMARTGDMGELFIYFGFEDAGYWRFAGFNLDNSNWREQLPAVRAHINSLKKRGL